LHLDTDEANAAGLQSGDEVLLAELEVGASLGGR